MESVKTAADVYAPCEGVVTDVNSAIEKDPSIVNKSAEKDGWLFKTVVTSKTELGKNK
jgi:glycine cleavage system H protein